MTKPALIAKALTVIDSDEIKKKIAFDEALANQHGVTGTPSLFLNGKNVSNFDVKDGKTSSPQTMIHQLRPYGRTKHTFDTLILQPALEKPAFSKTRTYQKHPGAWGVL